MDNKNKPDFFTATTNTPNKCCFLKKLFGKSKNIVDDKLYLFEKIINKNSEAIIITDVKDKTIFANESFVKLLKNDLTASLENFTLSFKNSNEISQLLNKLKKQASPAGIAKTEFYLQQNENKTLTQIICHYILIESNSYIIWQFIDASASKIEDIQKPTETCEAIKQQADNISQELQNSEERLQRLFEESPLGICIINQDKEIENANQKLIKMLGKNADEINNSFLLDHIKTEHHTQLMDWLKNISDEQEDKYFEVSLNSAREKIVQLYANKLKADASIVLHFIDLTERKHLEQQFAQSQKMQAIGQLAGGIAHDFNNLLTAMIGFADLLLLRHKPGDPSFSDINQIKQNANRASNMVRQLLAFSRQQTLKASVIDLSDAIAELSHLLRRLIGVNIELNISHKNADAIVKTDQGQLEQVLINLVVNARDAMPSGGTITINTETITTSEKINLNGEDTLPKGEWAVISVTDTGTGIPEDIMEHIFEPFFSTKPIGAGTGLGLATVHGIVHQTGGRIYVTSELGRGTTFKIYLPKYNNIADNALDEKETEKTNEESKVSDLTGSSSILLVEDEDAVRIFSSRALGNKGYNVVDVASGDAALKVLEEKDFKPDLLITDVMMPEMDGTTLAKIVAEKYPEMKIIFISGYAEDKFKEHVGGNAYFLPKPFTLKQLAERVKEVIEA